MCDYSEKMCSLCAKSYKTAQQIKEPHTRTAHSAHITAETPYTSRDKSDKTGGRFSMRFNGVADINSTYNSMRGEIVKVRKKL